VLRLSSPPLSDANEGRDTLNNNVWKNTRLLEAILVSSKPERQTDPVGVEATGVMDGADPGSEERKESHETTDESVESVAETTPTSSGFKDLGQRNTDGSGGTDPASVSSAEKATAQEDQESQSDTSQVASLEQPSRGAVPHDDDGSTAEPANQTGIDRDQHERSAGKTEINAQSKAVGVQDPPPAGKPHYPNDVVRDSGVTFRIRNAMVHVPYDFAFTTFRSPIHSVWFIYQNTPALEYAGLRFSASPPRLVGTPEIDGDVTARIIFEKMDKSLAFTDTRFFVNKNPRDMWVPMEPADGADLPWKPHQIVRSLPSDPTYAGPQWDLFGASIRGRAHAREAKYREDDFSVGRGASIPSWHVVVSCDGAGSAPLSRIGSATIARTITEFLIWTLDERGGTSKLPSAAHEGPSPISSETATSEAQPALGATLNSLLDKPQNADHLEVMKSLVDVFRVGAWKAVDAISALAKSSARAEKDFNSTLLVAISRQIPQLNKTFVATFQVGDGAIGVGVPGTHGVVQWQMYGKPDKGEYAGETVFLDRRVLNELDTVTSHITCGWFDVMPMILAMSDGVSDPRFQYQATPEDSDAWNLLWSDVRSALPAHSLESPSSDWEAKLIAVLEHYDEGHHDDRTIVIARPATHSEEPTNHA